ncbi:MAG: FecR domain-containing protein [Gammaproteobacteria bacterium]|nr:FecR domain-containing protein [Gammaproteobacteria bacterium]
MNRANRKYIGCLLVAITAIGVVGEAAAQQIGEVLDARGAFTARQPDSGEIRFLGKGMAVARRDVLTTGRNGFAVLEMRDGAKITLRPDTEFAIEQYAEQPEPGQEQSIALRLFRGGLRTVTGLISRGRPASYRLNTPTATIGVRGTEFDLRVCGTDCNQEEREHAQRPASTQDLNQVAGRVILARGQSTATSLSGTERPLGNGAIVYSGDMLRTAVDGVVAVVFRDDTRIVLRPNTEFAIDNYSYRKSGPTENDGILLRVVRGGVRSLTGLLASRDRSRFRISTPAATIGVRGTGFDVYVAEHCDEGREALNQQPAETDNCVYVDVWDGTVDASQGSRSTVVASGQTAFAADENAAPALLAARPAFMSEGDAPRPDSLSPNLEDLFGAEPGDSVAAGTYLNVADGNVYLEAPDGRLLELGRGQTGYLDPAGGSMRLLDGTPLFFLEDPYPRASRFDDSVARAFDLLGDSFDNLGDINSASDLQCTIQ